MTEPTAIYHVGDVVQIDPAHDPMFGAHFLVVTEVKTWGVQGYVTPLTARETVTSAPSLAYYRVANEHIVLIGRAEWLSE